MFASANSHVWKKYNEPATAEGKLVGVKGALHCGTCSKVPHNSKVTTGTCPPSVPCHPYFSGEGWNLLLILIERMNITVFQMTTFGPHVSLRNLCWLNLLVENWQFIKFLDIATDDFEKSICSSIYLLLFCSKASFYFKCRWL